MLELTYANCTESLLDHLSMRIEAERGEGKGPWEPIHIVVPSPYLKEYVRLALAKKLGVAANLHFSYLAGLWKDLLKDETCRVLDLDLLRSGLLAVFGDEVRLGHALLQPVREYLAGSGLGLKRIQLAGELARVFEEYQLSRPEWIEAWRKGRSAGCDASQEAWQAHLWREVVDVLGKAGAPMQVLTLPELVRSGGFSRLDLPRAIHAFGLSHVAQAYQEIYRAFGELADTTLHLYALNPCEEFWEDLESEHHPGDSEDPFALLSQGPRALRFWGRPGRENIRLLNEASQCDFTPAFRTPEGTSLLAAIQRDILAYQEPEDCFEAPDDSLRLMACPSLRREAEAVATEIWRLMERHQETDKPLHFSEIAVVVPSGAQEAYRLHLQTAFQDARQIPWIMCDRALPIMRQTLEAVERLLELPGSGLTRAALLRVLEHPGLRARFPDLDPGTWALWCETLGIVRGADRGDWKDTYLQQDALSWDQGLKRLALGTFLTEDVEFELGGEHYLANGSSDEALGAAFTCLVRGLCADAKALQHISLEPRAFLRRISDYVERWLEVEEGEQAEAILKALARIRTFLERAFMQTPEALELPAVDFAGARDLALEALQRLKDEQPANLAKGVVVATYSTARAIPFRALFLMGLGEGSYPTRNSRSALDLRGLARRPGDVSQVEKEKYLFLELLLSAREHLVLSHVGMDELSGEALEPSSLWKEFRLLLGDYLGDGWAAEDGMDPLLVHPPMHRFDPSGFSEWFGIENGIPSYSLAAEAEARALWLKERAREQGFKPGTLGAHGLAAFPESIAPRLRGMLGASTVPDAMALPDRLRIRLSDLRTFLNCPLSGAALVRLGLRERTLEDRAAVEDEPFESELLEVWSLQQETVLKVLRSGETAKDAMRRSLRSRQAQGRMPLGLFAEVEIEEQLQTVEAWATYLRDKEADPRPELWRLGSGPRASEADHVLPPLVLELELHGKRHRVELEGELKPQLHGSLFLEKGQAPSVRKELGKKALPAYLDHLVLACLKEGHGEHRARFVFEKSKTPKGTKVPLQEECFAFPALTREEAEARLKGLLEDLLTGNHAVLMPIEAVLEGWPDDLSRESILAYVDQQLEQGERGGFSTLRGPVPDPTRFPPPEDPKSLAQARLGAFLDIVSEVG